MREADNLTTSLPECHEIWEPKPPGTLWVTQGPLRDSFTFYSFTLETESVENVTLEPILQRIVSVPH